MWALTLFLYYTFQKFASSFTKSTKSERQQVIINNELIYDANVNTFFENPNVMLLKCVIFSLITFTNDIAYCFCLLPLSVLRSPIISHISTLNN